MSDSQKEEPKPYTVDEVREKFVRQVLAHVRYWAGGPGSNVPAHYTADQRIRGAIFSTLVLLDGGSTAMPGFILVPAPHPSDKAFCIERGERYYEPVADVLGDIAGGLHELMCELERKDRGE